MKLILFDIDPKVVKAFKYYFNNFVKDTHSVVSSTGESNGVRDSLDNIEIKQADVRDLLDELDMVVSPANSYGFMDGGVDEVYMQIFYQIEDKVKNKIKQEYNGKLCIGECMMTDTLHPHCHTLLSAPTMVFPSKIKSIVVIRDAFRAVLDCVHKYESIIMWKLQSVFQDWVPEWEKLIQTIWANR